MRVPATLPIHHALNFLSEKLLNIVFTNNFILSYFFIPEPIPFMSIQKNSIQKKKTISQLILTLLASMAMALTPPQASAVTECNQSLKNMYVGDGVLWVVFEGGGQGKIFQTSVDFKPIYALFLTAISTQKNVVVRYAADNADCNSLQDIKGVWLAR